MSGFAMFRLIDVVLDTAAPVVPSNVLLFDPTRSITELLLTTLPVGRVSADVVLAR